MKPHEKLDVWQASIELVKEIYRLTKNFLKDELCRLVMQMWRAAVSVAVNIAEGPSGKQKQNLIGSFL